MTRISAFVVTLLAALAAGTNAELEHPKFSLEDLPKGFQLPKHLDHILNETYWNEMDAIDPKIVEDLKLGDGKEFDENGEVTCIHLFKTMAAKSLPAFNECMKDMQLTLGKLRKNIRDVMPCMAKCMGVKLKILHEDGLVNFDYARTFLISHVPPRFMEIVWKVWDKCVELAKNLQPNDPHCKTYRPIIKCAANAAFEVAEEALKLCPDIPEVFKKSARRIIKQKKERSQTFMED